jgi:hypothetical protein
MSILSSAPTVQAFYLMGALFVILTGAIVGYFILQPVLDPPPPDWALIYDNGYVSNISLVEGNAKCVFGVRDCTNCPNAQVEEMMGCCTGCKNPDSCNLEVQVSWNNVPPRIPAQRIFLLVSSDCSTWWQTGWAPYVVTAPVNRNTSATSTATPTSSSSASGPALVAARSVGTEEEYFYYDDEDDGTSLYGRSLSDLVGGIDLNETAIAADCSGNATITNGCFGDPYRPLVFAGCLTTRSESDFLGKEWSSFPWELCISAYGSCINLDYVFVKEMSCCVNNIWAPEMVHPVPPDPPYPGTE